MVRREDDDIGQSYWHLSKSVPISVILAIFVQTLGVVIWAVRIDARVSALETADLSHTARVQRLEETASRLTLIEERQRVVIQTLDRNAEKIDGIVRALSDKPLLPR